MMDNMIEDADKPTIRWTRAKLAALKKEYAKHEDDPHAVFMFEGHELLVAYAKYLIEYLESNLKMLPPP